MKKTIYNTKLYAKGRRGFAASVVEGLASLFVLATPMSPPKRLRTERATKALRGDFVRIGMDMRKAAAAVIHEETSR